MTTDFFEFGHAVEAPAENINIEVIYDLLAFHYKKEQAKTFPEYQGGYEIKTSGVQGRSIIYRLDGEQVEESVANAYYGLDEEDNYVGRSDDYVLPEGHATKLTFYQQFGWYAQVPKELVSQEII